MSQPPEHRAAGGAFAPAQAIVVSLALFAACVVGSGCGILRGEGCSPSKIEGRHKVNIARTNYHGWTNCIVMRSGGTEAVIVPAIGRILQFGFAGEEGMFWENRALDSQIHPPRATTWMNFGGDKSWPAPEAEWPKPQGGWLPPAAFDSTSVEAKIERDQVILTSPVDAEYGIRVVRRIYFGRAAGQMTVSTRYEKVSGEPKTVAIWTITQLREPVGVFSRVPLPDAATNEFSRVHPGFENGYRLLSKSAPPDLKVLRDSAGAHGTLSLTRNPGASYKIGLAAASLLWVGERTLLKIDLQQAGHGEFPDGGSSAEIYTNPDPLRYVELELLGHLSTLKAGSVIESANTYTPFRRSHPSPEQEAWTLYGRQGL